MKDEEPTWSTIGVEPWLRQSSPDFRLRARRRLRLGEEGPRKASSPSLASLSIGATTDTPQTGLASSTTSGRRARGEGSEVTRSPSFPSNLSQARRLVHLWRSIRRRSEPDGRWKTRVEPAGPSTCHR